MAKHSAEAEAEAKCPQNQNAVLNCIDLSNPNTNQSVNLLKQACTDSGFFYLVNHGISQDLMDQVFAQSKKLFTLPLNQKMKLLRNDKHRGYTPLRDEILDRKNQLHGDAKEGYYLGVEVAEDDPRSQKPFLWAKHMACIRYFARMEGNYGKVPTPDIGGKASLHPTFVNFLLMLFYGISREVGKAVAKLIALALGLDANFFDKPEILGEPIAMMRLLHYEGIEPVVLVDQISDPSKGLYGAGAHSDYGLITLLATDDVPGLQICKDKDAKPQIWEDVAPMKGAFIVNLGDMLERWSNCVFK
ncbi:Oxoglutarate/iron-dependent dioxygenase [Sesbania bispinosa]|nr:Oxoglutarate/iron-dependent dioxygenase [Sesbania bispinosa]